MTKKEQRALQKFASHIKTSTYVEFLDNFGGSRTKWLHVLYVLKEDIDKNIQRLENNKKQRDMDDNTLRNFDLIMAMCHIIQAEANKIDRCSIQVLATTKDEYMKDTYLEHQEFVENIVRKLDDITAEIFEFENAAAYVNEIDIEMYKPILDQLEEWRKNHKIEEKIPFSVVKKQK